MTLPAHPASTHDPSPHRRVLLDAPDGECFDRLTRLAARSVQAEWSLLNLIDDEGELCRSAFDAAGRYQAGGRSGLDESICRYVVQTATPLVVEDARAHPLLRDIPAVREGRVVAYLGIPLSDPDGNAFGTLCVTDSRPRRWTPEQVEVLSDLAASVNTEIELRVDMALRQAAERSLAESEARLRLIFDRAAVGITLVDMNGRPVQCNAALIRMLGYEWDELRALTFRDVTHPDDLAVDEALFTTLLAGERDSYTVEKRYIRRDGSILPARLTVSVSRDGAGGARFIVAVVEDLGTARELARARAELEVLAGLLPICMHCKQIRNDEGKWEQLESYISSRSAANFSHGCCPDCIDQIWK